MGPLRPYVPTIALLRALARPRPLLCLFARHKNTNPGHGKPRRAAKETRPRNSPNSPFTSKQSAKLIEDCIKKLENTDLDSQDVRPLTDHELESDGIPAISWYEQDLDKGTPMRLIERIATAEDRKRNRDTLAMIEESEKNPDYDNAHLNRRLIDSLITNPNFTHLTQELKDIKEDIKTKEELEAIKEQTEQQRKASVKRAAQQSLLDLIEDPDAADARDDLQEALDWFPKIEDIEDPEFLAALNKATTRLNAIPAFQKKMEVMAAAHAAAERKEMAQMNKEYGKYGAEIDKVIRASEALDAGVDPPQPSDGIEDIDKLLHQMRDLFKLLGGDSNIEAELEEVINYDPNAKQEGDFQREMEPTELASEILALVKSKEAEMQARRPEKNVSVEMQAKVDKILEDPMLIEKLTYIQKLIEEAGCGKSDITQVSHDVAPDPYELDSDRTATLKQRMEVVRQEPEHIAALERLRVRLLPPFNISPALKSFNQAIEYAYIGANDDIRRILWRCYQKARKLPTFLQNLSDDAWDILYYSQAVTWSSNQNRENHLRMVLADLKSLGRDGPPTHPKSLIKGNN